MKNKNKKQIQTSIEEIPDGCLPPDNVLASLGFEKIPTAQGKPELRDQARNHAEALAEASKRVVNSEDAVAGLDETEMSESQWQERELAWSELREALAAWEASKQ